MFDDDDDAFFVLPWVALPKQKLSRRLMIARSIGSIGTESDCYCRKLLHFALARRIDCLCRSVLDDDDDDDFVRSFLLNFIIANLQIRHRPRHLPCPRNIPRHPLLTRNLTVEFELLVITLFYDTLLIRPRSELWGCVDETSHISI